MKCVSCYLVNIVNIFLTFPIFHVFEKENLKTLFSAVRSPDNLLMDRWNLIPCFSTHSPVNISWERVVKIRQL